MATKLKSKWLVFISTFLMCFGIFLGIKYTRDIFIDKNFNPYEEVNQSFDALYTKEIINKLSHLDIEIPTDDKEKKSLSQVELQTLWQEYEVKLKSLDDATEGTKIISLLNERDQKIQEIQSLQTPKDLELFEELKEIGLTYETIPDEAVQDYRYRYGGFDTQVLNIKDQYKPKLSEAQKEDNKEKIARLTLEKDLKTQAIIQNFSDNDVVKRKILKEGIQGLLGNKEATLKTIEEMTEKMNQNYYYSFTDTNGNLYTNIKEMGIAVSKKEMKEKLEPLGVGQMESFSNLASFDQFVSYQGSYTSQKYSGYAIVAKKSPLAKTQEKQLRYKKKAQLIIVFAAILLIVGLGLTLVYINQKVYWKKTSNFIKKIPVDARILLFVCFVFFTLIVLFLTVSVYDYYMRPLRMTVLGLGMVTLYVCTLLLTAFIKNFWKSFKQEDGHLSIKTQFQDSFLSRVTTKSWLVTSKVISVFIIFSVMLLLLCFQLGILLFGDVFSTSVFLLIILSCALLLTFLISMTKREKKIQELLSLPNKILSDNQELVPDSRNLHNVSENLIQLAEIVKGSKMHTKKNEELKTELLTNVSHDLRTPLTSIISYGNLLTQDNISEQDREEYLAILNRKAYRMKHLIDDLFEVTKMNNGEITLKKEDINLDQLIQQALAEYSEELDTHELKISYTKPEHPIVTLLDGEKIWRVLDNLITNTIKYSLPQTRVYLKLSLEDDQVRLSLRNISQYELNENATVLVERFKRADDSRHTEGSGLGLAIVNSIITLHDGQFEIMVEGDMFKAFIALPYIKSS